MRAFSACLALFLAMASAVALAQHLGLLWVAVSGSTLASAPLIYFNRNRLSIEATWKFLMLGSVGIALALLGSFFLAYAAHLGGHGSSLLFARLEAGATELSRPWLRAAFVLFLVGYGTKMGIAPLHTWKPDAYGEAPGMVGALLAGGATSAAFLALLRVYRIVNLGGEGEFARRLLVGMGLFSMLWVAVFMARQRDIKRMLAYSSVEQMGILLLGMGVGGTFGSLLHMVNSGLIKGVMFLAAGNIHRAFDSKRVRDISGAMRRLSVELSKVASDLRLLSMGPRAGLGEIALPAVQPGTPPAPLGELSTFPQWVRAQRQSGGHLYAQAFLGAELLIDTHGVGGVAEYFARFAYGTERRQAFADSFGMDLREFEGVLQRGWHQAVLQRQRR